MAHFKLNYKEHQAKLDLSSLANQFFLDASTNSLDYKGTDLGL